MAHTEAGALINLLERLADRDGYTLTTHQPDLAPLRHSLKHTAFSPLTAHLPASLAAYPDTSIDEHLTDGSDVQTQVITKALGSGVVAAAHQLVDAEFAHIDAQVRTPGHERLPLHRKLIALRLSQARALPSPDTFPITAISGICPLTGLSTGSQTYHLPSNITWPGLLSALQDMTRCWQARENGIPHGYTLTHGKWLYQLASDVAGKAIHDLTSADDYKRMRKRLTSEDAGSLLVWHERLWTASQSLRAARAADLGSMTDDRLNHRQSWEVFDPFSTAQTDDGQELDWGVGTVAAVAEEQHGEPDGAVKRSARKRKAGNDVLDSTPKRSRPQTRASSRLTG